MSKGLRIAGAIGIALAALIFAFAVGRPIKVLPRMAPAPPFELLDPWGKPVSAPREDAKITLYTFGALRDQEGMARIRAFYDEAHRALSDAGFADAVEFVFITVDPDHDDPEALRRAIASPPTVRSLPPQMMPLTGSWIAIRMVVGTGFGVYFQPPAVEAHQGAGQLAAALPPPKYDPTVIVVDRDHVIRARYALNQFDTGTLVRDVNLLVKEANAQGATRWIYEGAHLFLCYPR